MTTLKPARSKRRTVASWRLPFGRPIFSLGPLPAGGGAGRAEEERVVALVDFAAMSGLDGNCAARETPHDCTGGVIQCQSTVWTARWVLVRTPPARSRPRRAPRRA